MKHHDLTNWRPFCKLTMRISPDAMTVAESMIYNFHADVAEYTLLSRGILPELRAYLDGIGESVR